MGITISKKTVEPVAAPKSEVLTALKMVSSSKQTLMLISRKTGEGIQVLAFNEYDGLMLLKNRYGAKFRPQYYQKMDEDYEILWR